MSIAVGIILYWVMFMSILPRIMRPEVLSVLPLVSGIVGSLSCALLYFAVVNLAFPLKKKSTSSSGVTLIRRAGDVYAKSAHSSLVVARTSTSLNKEKQFIRGRTGTFAFLSVFLGCYVTAVLLFGTLTPFMAIATESMKPTYNPGDLILIKSTRDIRVGDVIAFNVPPPHDLETSSPIVHRVIKIEQLNGIIFYKTRGDNNPKADPWIVPAANVIGKVIYDVPMLGYLILYLRNPYVLATVIAALTVWTLYPYFRR